MQSAILALALAAAPAAALVAPSAQSTSAVVQKAVAGASIKDMSGGVQAGDPMPGEGPWDPMGFSVIHDAIQGSEHAGVFPAPQWMREAEIKHGRVAMLAFTGALVQSYGMHFDGKLNGMRARRAGSPSDGVAAPPRPGAG